MSTNINYRELFLNDIRFFKSLLEHKNDTEQDAIIKQLAKELKVSLIKVIKSVNCGVVTQFIDKQNLNYLKVKKCTK